MADFIIKESTAMGMPPQAEPVKTYEVQYTKEAQTVDGKTVTVIDSNRVERTTVDQLEAQKAQYQKIIDELDAKLAEIEKL